MSDIASGHTDRLGDAVGGFHHSRPLGRAAFALGVAFMLAACSGPGTVPPGAPTVPPTADSAASPRRPLLEVTQLAALETLSPPALIARLGEPDFTRRDPPAEIWQYRGTNCVLDLFLYPEDGELHVLHAVTRARDRVRAPENSCTPFGPTRSAAADS
ncbi:MAG: hypothetical protein WCC64_17170 [Aliidongia sp.]